LLRELVEAKAEFVLPVWVGGISLVPRLLSLDASQGALCSDPADPT
jgi:hypothetical protein